MTLHFTVLELSCLLHIRLQEELVRFAMKKKRIAFCMFFFRTLPYLKMKYSGRVILLKIVCVRITLLVFPLFQTFFPYKFLNVFLRKVA